MTGTVRQVEELFSWLTKWRGDRDELAQLVSLFQDTGPFEPDQVLAPAEVIPGLTHSLHTTRFGIWLDHRESHELLARCQGMIEYRVGRPSAYFDEPETYTDFEWEGSSVEDGLRAFDRWLAVENAVFREGFPPFRLLNIETGADYFLAALCREDALHAVQASLDACGVQASTFVP